MRKLISLSLIISMLFLFVSCDTQFGRKQVTDPEKYGKIESYLDFPEFFPETIDDYTVNSYSYTLLAYMDICYEIFLDISVTEEQFNTIISNIKNFDGIVAEREAYYADGYYEIVFVDNYRIDSYDLDESEPLRVGSASIEKVIYNPERYNIVFENFYTIDSGVYPLDEVAYFNRFGINQNEYKKFITFN